MKKVSALTLLLLSLTLQLLAQSNRRVSGSATDSTKIAIPRAKVMIIVGKDTLTTETDNEGDFSISRINVDRFSILITIAGYHDFRAEYSFAEKERHKRLAPFILRISNHMLKEVVIKAKPNPVRFMQDTVEYNAAAFEVHEGDNVADLLKQFPGMEIDDQYNVKTMGKEMVKLRVNGKDFFTSDIKEFIGKLPAGIVSTIQVIDDFGDEANFTGIKIGEPRKMLNIVTKPGMSKGTFGGLSGNGGTNDRIGSDARVNRWDGDKQSSANVNANTSNNGAGNSRSLSLGVNHNDKWSKNSGGGFGYNFNNNSSAFAREQVIESLNPEGNFINNSNSEGNNGISSHSVNWSTNYNDKKVYMRANVNGRYSRSENQNISFNNQFGLIRQDLRNSNSSNNSAPNFNASFNLSKKTKNTKNALSGRANMGLSGNGSDQNIRTNTLYYDQNTGTLQKDSLLNRDLKSKTNSQNFSFGFDYSLGLKRPADTLGRQSLNLSYNGAAVKTMNSVSTFVFDNMSDKVSLVDSLSTSFSTMTLNQTFGISYNYSSSKSRYNLALNARPNLLSNRDLRLQQTTENNTFNYSPGLNFSRTLSKSKTLSLNYQGYNNNPTINQLQPIRNSQNLQNIVVGNPHLKPSFTHNVNSNFNYAHVKTGKSVQLGVNGSATQREIVNHVILVPDTLNSLKQITHYENVNGNYQVNGNYLVSIPIKQNKYSIRYSGTVGFSNRAVVFNNQRAFGKGVNFSQVLGGNLVYKKVTFSTQASYTITNNNDMNSLYGYSGYQTMGIGQISAPAFFRTTTFATTAEGSLRLKNLNLNVNANYNSNHNDATSEQSVRDISNAYLNISSRLTVKKSYFLHFSASKRANYGYALENSNPLIIDAGMEKSFFKDKSMSLRINGSDLLGQGNNISRVVSGNTIIDSRNRQQTRVISVNLNYNLSRFGGRHFRVDAD